MSEQPAMHLAQAVARLRRAMARELQTGRSRAAAEAARAERVAFVAEVALVRTAEIARLEEQLIRAAPLADERLRGMADMAAWAMARLVQDQIEDPYRDQGCQLINPMMRRIRKWLGLALLVAVGIKAASFVIDPVLAVLAGLFVLFLFLTLLSDT